MVDDKNVGNIDLSDFCKICIESKQTRIQFQSRCSRLHRPYNTCTIVHSDVCGLIISSTSWNSIRNIFSHLSTTLHIFYNYLSLGE